MSKSPAKKWRVVVGSTDPKSTRVFRSESKAYEFVREQLPHGHRIEVRVWEDGRWRLFEILNDLCPEEG